jgi:hypothetical protein
MGCQSGLLRCDAHSRGEKSSESSRSSRSSGYIIDVEGESPENPGLRCIDPHEIIDTIRRGRKASHLPQGLREVIVRKETQAVMETGWRGNRRGESDTLAASVAVEPCQ